MVGRHGVDRAANAEIADLKRRPVEARVHLLGDNDLLRRDVGRRLVREQDRVWQSTIGSAEASGPVAGGANEVVWVAVFEFLGTAVPARREALLELTDKPSVIKRYGLRRF